HVPSSLRLTLLSHLHLSFFFYLSGAHRDLHSFPTRRSSDLGPGSPTSSASTPTAPWSPAIRWAASAPTNSDWPIPRPLPRRKHRSEEHTSELQSLRHLVCRLLLEKKKKKKTQSNHI